MEVHLGIGAISLLSILEFSFTNRNGGQLLLHPISIFADDLPDKPRHIGQDDDSQ
jgi:hypothetical protein